MARPRSTLHDVRRDEILEEAARCFAERSYTAASMADIAAACGTSKARLYHYYGTKDTILHALLDRYTLRLLAIVGETEAAAERKQLDERRTLHALIRAFLAEYEHSATRHIALLESVRFLPEPPRTQILDRQRDVVSAVARFLRRAYPHRINARNQTPVTMMLFGMINWTFTWLRPGGRLGYAAFADQVIALLEHGLADATSPSGAVT